jgi:hypothetical protein
MLFGKRHSLLNHIRKLVFLLHKQLGVIEMDFDRHSNK